MSTNECAEAFKFERELRGLGRPVVAKWLGVHAATIQKYEEGRSEPGGKLQRGIWELLSMWIDEDKYALRALGQGDEHKPIDIRIRMAIREGVLRQERYLNFNNVPSLSA